MTDYGIVDGQKLSTRHAGEDRLVLDPGSRVAVSPGGFHLKTL